jgi:hypothetical protein
MITLDDWSELITIDYNGGLSGEFFGFLLHEAIYKESVYKEIKNNKFDFIEYDVFASSDKTKNRNERLILKKLFYLKEKYYNYDSSFRDFKDKKLTESYNEIFNNKSTFSEEYKNYVYKNYSDRFDGRLKISLFHDISNELNKKYNINFQEIFSKSKNIMLVCPDHYMFFSKFLLTIKVISHHSLSKNNKELKNFIDSQYDKFIDFHFYSFDDYPCLKLDIYSFLYEQTDYDKQLSDLLGQKIILNKQKINEYAQKNIELFNQYGLDVDAVYSKNTFKEKIDYFIRNCC